MSPSGSAPGAVVLRGSRLPTLVLLILGGLVEAGIVVALVGAAQDGSFDVGGAATSGMGTGLVAAVLVPLAVLIGLGLCALALSSVWPLTATVVGPDGIRVLTGGRVRTRITPSDATRIVYHPAGDGTGNSSGRRGRDGRAGARLEVRGPEGAVELGDTRRWGEVVDVLRGWAAARPDLVNDAVTAELLLDSGAHFP